ncbi:MAG: hypothetical protein ACOYT9_00385, partial [Patescibacteria group bacterium]
MKTLSEFQQELGQLLNQEPVPVDKLKRLFADLNDYIYSPEYERLSFADKEQVQELFDSVSNMLQDEPQTEPQVSPSTSEQQSPKVETNPEVEPGTRHHDENAEKMMDEAEEAFYAGRYADAIRLYEKTLSIEATWERATEHLEQAKEYLRSGVIPAVALPPEAAINYGKASSAMRVGRYADAKQLLSYAKEALAESGIKKWKEGLEFEIELEKLIQAELVVKEAVEHFNQGQIDESIQQLDGVYKETNIPRYKDLADKYRNFKSVQQRISDIFFASNTATPDMIIQAAQDMEKLGAEFRGNPTLQELRTKFDLIKPGLTGTLRQEIRNLKTQADRSKDMDTARQYAMDAKERIGLAVRLGLTDGMFTSTSKEVHQLLADLDSYQQDLETAGNLLLKNSIWPKEAWDSSQEVRRRFPNDPSVIRVSKKLVTYQYVRIAIRTGISFFFLLALFGVWTWGSQKFREYQLALTPSATPTFTSTVTPTPTNTSTPLPPTATPTPMVGRVIRRVWARNGCYENYTYNGTIPEGATVKLLPTDGERRFDPLNRECILVEYKGSNTSTSIIGWILIQDFEP